MKFKLDTKTITGIGILLAIEIVLQVVGNFVAIGPISINLSLVPIVIAALLYGPWGGFILGFFCGVLVLPSGFAVMLMGYNPICTVLICLLKTSIAGFLAGLVYLPFKEKEDKLKIVGTVLAGLTVPVINTGIFVGMMLLCFQDYLQTASTGFANPFTFVILGLVSWNFIFEVVSTSVLSPTIYKIVDILKKRANQ